jgi:hypothetical protein
MSKGKQLLDDFLDKLGVSLRKAREQNVITLDDLKPAWEARERLEAYLDPPRDDKGHWLPQQDTRSTKAKKGVQKNATTHYREEG